MPYKDPATRRLKQAEWARKDRKKNPDRWRERKRKWRKENKEKYLEERRRHDKRFRAKYPEKEAKRKKSWRIRNRQTFLASKKRQYAKKTYRGYASVLPILRILKEAIHEKEKNENPIH